MAKLRVVRALSLLLLSGALVLATGCSSGGGGGKKAADGTGTTGKDGVGTSIPDQGGINGDATFTGNDGTTTGGDTTSTGGDTTSTSKDPGGTTDKDNGGGSDIVLIQPDPGTGNPDTTPGTDPGGTTTGAKAACKTLVMCLIGCQVDAQSCQDGGGDATTCQQNMQSCMQQCQTNNPAGVPNLQAIDDCVTTTCGQQPQPATPAWTTCSGDAQGPGGACATQVNACLAGSSTCQDILGCVNACPAQPEKDQILCQQNCLFDGELGAQKAVLDLSGCATDNCPACASGDQTGCQTCVQSTCAGQLAACFGSPFTTGPSFREFRRSASQEQLWRDLPTATDLYRNFIDMK